MVEPWWDRRLQAIYMYNNIFDNVKVMVLDLDREKILETIEKDLEYYEDWLKNE